MYLVHERIEYALCSPTCPVCLRVKVYRVCFFNLRSLLLNVDVLCLFSFTVSSLNVCKVSLSDQPVCH